MPLTNGTRLGPYEIVAALGAGGMGEVYRARDSRLDRTVAIKVLPAHIAADPQSRERFEREARTIAALRHPHICTLYDIGEATAEPRVETGAHTVQFLVMEYLEGETLAKRLERGRVPLDHALAYAIQIADALDRAHRAGVVHRDLKPANVMLTQDGTKLLDFGIAKMAAFGAARTPAAGAATVGETLSHDAAPLTLQGLVVGTIQYMPPEQLEGKQVDGRADIFALGTILYEMLTGRRAFEGSSPASAAAAVLTSEPQPIAAPGRELPADLEWVVRACLQKDVESRWQSAADLKLQLQRIVERPPASAIAARPRARRITAMWAATVVVVALAAAVIGSRVARRTSDAAREPVRFSIDLSKTPLSLGQNVLPALALSPDGRRLIYAVQEAGATRLYDRPLDAFASRPLPGTERGGHPFFSPDGTTVGFFADAKLKTLSLADGSTRVVASVPALRGASWASPDEIVLSPSATSGLSRVAATGGTLEVLTEPKLDAGDVSHRWPDILPGGDVLYTARPSGQTFDQAEITVLVRRTGERRSLLRGYVARFVPTGHLVFIRAGTLHAVRFDPSTIRMVGSPVPIVQGVAAAADSGVAHFAVSKAGVLAYVPGATADARTLVWVDRQGHETAVPGFPRQSYQTPTLSPDGRQLAVTVLGSTHDVWVGDLTRATLTRLTVEGDNHVATWTPDGGRVVLNAQRSSKYTVYAIAPGGGPEERLVTGPDEAYAGSWSADGRTLALSVVSAANQQDVWLLRRDRGGLAAPLLQTAFDERDPAISPDGRWLAYSSNQTGRYEVYMRPLDPSGGTEQVSNAGGTQPVWRRDGRELFYRNGDEMVAVGLTVTPSSVAATIPHVLFRGNYAPGFTQYQRTYDVTPDGSRLLMVRSEQPPLTEIRVVLDWFSELRRRVP